ncbi:Outer membrane protein assembly factor BamB [Planctomycetales bacterium 10988]|nr:Outer membrane protein assembly factor BamB [Planctomycetales bacterium 10988]
MAASGELNPQDSPATKKVHWLRPMLWLIVGIGLIAIIQALPHLWSMKTVVSLGIGFLTSIALVLWVLFLSGLRWPTKLGILSPFILALVVFFSLFRFDGLYGDMMPRFVSRFAPTPEQQLADYQKEQDAKEKKETSIDLAIGPRDWPGYLGENRQGIQPEVMLNPDWETHPPKELWRHPVGLGWSSFAIVGDYCFTQEQRSIQQDGKPVDAEVVVCYEVKTGEEVWKFGEPGRFAEPMGGDGARATPVVHQGRIYAQLAYGPLLCLEGSTGELLWSVNILEDNDAKNLHWGLSGSPLIYEEMVIVCAGGGDGKSLVAYHKLTGEKLWSGGSDQAGYSSPLVTNIHGEPQIVIFNGIGLVGHDPKDGKQLWSFPWRAGPERVTCSQPMPLADYGVKDGENKIFISASYGAGSALVEIQKEGDGFKAVSAWESMRLKSKFASLVIDEGYVYGLNETILTCLQLEKGRPMWKGGRYGYGQLIQVGDLILIQAEDGEVVLVRPNPKKHEELATFPALSSKTWNVPALADRYLIVRNDREAACFELTLQEEETPEADESPNSEAEETPASEETSE